VGPAGRRDDRPVTFADVMDGPVVVAPMAGGPSTVELVRAAGAAGALGFVAAGYRSATALAADVAALRSTGTGAFGVNVFVPGGPTSDPDGLQRHLAAIAADAARLGAELAAATWDDDDWDAKLALLLDDPVPVVSFTFGCPERHVVRSLQQRGTVVVATVTTAAEADVAEAAGVDALCAQGLEAGAHRGTFAADGELHAGLPTLELVRALTAGTRLPVVAAGGIMDEADVAAALAAGAVAVQCGTAFLLCDESGANATYRAALVDDRFTETALTRAFSGRPARGLRNAFIADHPDAPAAYPEVNNATRPLRAAAAAAGDPDRMSLWAGEGWRRAATGPAATVVARLAAGAR
jgi:nitronate monooxygenase